MLKFSAFYLEKQKMAFSVLIFSEGFGTIYLDYLCCTLLATRVPPFTTAIYT